MANACILRKTIMQSSLENRPLRIAQATAADIPGGTNWGTLLSLAPMDYPRAGRDGRPQGNICLFWNRWST